MSRKIAFSRKLRRCKNILISRKNGIFFLNSLVVPYFKYQASFNYPTRSDYLTIDCDLARNVLLLQCSCNMYLQLQFHGKIYQYFNFLKNQPTYFLFSIFFPQNTKNKTAVKLTAVSCAPVVEVKIKRPDTKYQLGFSVQNGVVSKKSQIIERSTNYEKKNYQIVVRCLNGF